MEIEYHPAVRKDIREIVKYYDEQSDSAGDRFVDELHESIERVRENPTRFHLADEKRRRCNLRKFPYHFIYEIRNENVIRILLLRHHRRHPSFGMTRD